MLNKQLTTLEFCYIYPPKKKAFFSNKSQDEVPEKLSFSLKKSIMRVSAARESIQLVIENLRSMRTEENFKKFWLQMLNDIDKLQVTCFAGLDSFTGEIEKRFNQPDFAVYNNLERLLTLKAKDWTNKRRGMVKQKNVGLGGVCCVHLYISVCACVCERGLQAETEQQCRTIPPSNLNPLVDKMKMQQPDSRLLFNDVDCLIQNLLVVSISSSTAERRFPLLRRVKCYLRSTMSQVHINHAFIMRTFQEELDNLDV
ncbi:hypothetical protein PR048_002742 [Dryococelus australis]|uniref:HAT C-terminal dimerisation domain-containing protein n=1 Tax=Dryococelus australis TaxID=614101 RepID=A0ABQ9IM52_9NEOP|nr:hypothetical protein PR048_002742 [Dryococelus australis]